MKITKVIAFDRTKLLIDGVPHLTFPHDELTCLHTWRTYLGRYYIELTFKDGAVTTADYDTFSKWRTIVNLIYSNNQVVR